MKTDNINWEDVLLDGMSEHNRKVLSNIDADECDGTLPLNKIIHYENALRKRKRGEEDDAYNPDAKDKDYADIKVKKILNQQKKIQHLHDTADIKLRDIIPEQSLAQQEIKKYPELKSDIFTQTINFEKPLDELKQSQRLNTFDSINRFGKQVIRVVGITKTGARIMRNKHFSFGSIDDYDIDTLPIHAIRGKGQEITYLSQFSKSDGERVLISRRFMSRIISEWSHIVGLNYGGKSKVTGIKLWGIQLPQYSKTTYLLTGNDCKQALKDMLLIMRNDAISTLDKLKGKASPQLYRVIKARLSEKGSSISSIIEDMQDRLYEDYNIGRKAWSYPRIPSEYITKCIKLIDSGKYITDIYIPMIHNLRLYPLRNTDIKLKPMSDKDFEDSKKYYLINQYVAERY